MISLMMLTENPRETQILKMAFEQAQVKPLLSKPSYANYIKALQYVPDVILMEMPRHNNEQLHFARLIRQHRKTRHIPLIAYGDETDPALKRGMLRSGVESYLERPLKFSQLMQIVGARLKQQNKSLEVSSSRRPPGEKEQDIELILDPNTLATKKIELVVKHISGLMAFPFTVAKVLQLAGGDKSGASDLAKVIEADPVIATNILKVSNSVFFASANRRINSIKDAIVRVGFRETKRIVMGMAVMELFEKDSNSIGFDRVDYWYHSLATALFAERVAKRMGKINVEEAFLGGLLHDFGLLLFDEFFPTVFEKVLEATTNDGSSFNEAAIKLLGISHTDVVAELFELWKIPQVLAEAVTSQYSICDEQKTIDTPGKRMALCISIGNLLSKSYRFGALCDQYVIALDGWVFREARMPSGPGKALIDGVREEISMYRQFLKIDDRGPAGRGGIEDEARALHIGVVNFGDSPFVGPEEYLRSQGHRLQRVPPADSYSTFDGKFDAMLGWTGAETTPFEVAALLNTLQRKRDDRGKDDQTPPLAPVLAFVPDGSTLPRSPELAEASFMRQDFDLRLLDRSITMLLGGERVTVGQEDPEAGEVAV